MSISKKVERLKAKLCINLAATRRRTKITQFIASKKN